MNALQVLAQYVLLYLLEMSFNEDISFVISKWTKSQGIGYGISYVAFILCFSPKKYAAVAQNSEKYFNPAYKIKQKGYQTETSIVGKRMIHKKINLE